MFGFCFASPWKDRAESKHELEGAKTSLLSRSRPMHLLWSSAFLLLLRLGENKQLGSCVFISEVSALQGQKRGTKKRHSEHHSRFFRELKRNLWSEKLHRY